MSECVNVANVRFVAADTDSEQYSPRYMCMWMAHECKTQYNMYNTKKAYSGIMWTAPTLILAGRRDVRLQTGPGHTQG